MMGWEGMGWDSMVISPRFFFRFVEIQVDRVCLDFFLAFDFFTDCYLDGVKGKTDV